LEITCAAGAPEKRVEVDPQRHNHSPQYTGGREEALVRRCDDRTQEGEKTGREQAEEGKT
jgi:hypothetical protein